MELDDLKSPVCYWRSSPPNVSPSEVHIAVWEKVSTALHSLLTPAATTAKESAKTELKTSFKDKLVEDVKMSKTCFTSSLNIDCNTPMTSCTKEINKGLLSPPLKCPMFSPLRGRASSLVLPQKTRPGRFEPYIPRKKRLISQSCPTSPLCHDSLNDSDRSVCPLPSLKLSQSFLTWQDIKEQNKKITVDDLQSDSGYSSPASVSSCGSLPSGQSNLGTSLNDHLEDLHEQSDEKGNIGGQSDHFHEGSLICNDSKLSLKVCSSRRTNTDLLHQVDSLDLADKLEQLLPDCLLENPRDVKCSTTNDGVETKLEDFVKLSAEQDQFILNLLAL